MKPDNLEQSKKATNKQTIITNSLNTQLPTRKDKPKYVCDQIL